MTSLASAEVFVAQCSAADEYVITQSAAAGAAAASLDAFLQVVLMYSGLIS
jgi:hypothetical protein